MFEKRCGGVLCQIFGTRCNICGTTPLKEISTTCANTVNINTSAGGSAVSDKAANATVVIAGGSTSAIIEEAHRQAGPMAAADDDRSIRGGISLPMWMRTHSKSKLFTEKLDVDENTFSPPENDDSFLVFKYKSKPKVDSQLSSGSITITTGSTSNVVTPNTTAPNLQNLDISKHTAPCRGYIDGKAEVAPFQTTSAHGGVAKSTSNNGTNDNSESACGSSVIRVASQMISGKVVRGFEPYDEEEKEYLQSGGFDPKLRRGSRSLPASPLHTPSSSPKAQRKQVNKYFASNSYYTEENKPGSILASLLGKRDNQLSRSVTAIPEEEHKETQGQIASKLEALKLDEAKKQQQKVKQPKPSQLREMNFWSPTSM